MNQPFISSMFVQCFRKNSQLLPCRSQGLLVVSPAADRFITKLLQSDQRLRQLPVRSRLLPKLYSNILRLTDQRYLLLLVCFLLMEPMFSIFYRDLGLAHPLLQVGKQAGRLVYRLVISLLFRAQRQQRMIGAGTLQRPGRPLQLLLLRRKRREAILDLTF